VYTVLWRRLAIFQDTSVTALKKKHRLVQKEGNILYVVNEVTSEPATMWYISIITLKVCLSLTL
jgi:hypothetical protein